MRKFIEDLVIAFLSVVIIVVAILTNAGWEIILLGTLTLITTLISIIYQHIKK